MLHSTPRRDEDSPDGDDDTIEGMSDDLHGLPSYAEAVAQAQAEEKSEDDESDRESDRESETKKARRPKCDDDELYDKTPPTPCLWQAPASDRRPKCALTEAEEEEEE